MKNECYTDVQVSVRIHSGQKNTCKSTSENMEETSTPEDGASLDGCCW
jgi:hypothetical protein